MSGLTLAGVVGRFLFGSGTFLTVTNPHGLAWAGRRRIARSPALNASASLGFAGIPVRRRGGQGGGAGRLALRQRRHPDRGATGLAP
jgi:hypothetical protein